MATTLVYNGFTDLQAVKIENHSEEPVFAEDGITQETTRVVFTGTALITNATPATWKTQIDNARALLNQPRKTLTITVGATTYYTKTAPDDRDGPFPRFEFREIMGTRAAIVTFRIEVYDYQAPAAAPTKPNPIAHRWTQRWSYDEVGLATRSIIGSVTVNAGASASTSSSAATAASFNAGSNPEAYRLAVLPALPPGFRRIRQEFATDETGNRLLYTIEDREYTRGLPSPARGGDCSFTWRKSLESGGASLGVKTFRCELFGSRNTSGAALLAAAIVLAGNRIKFTGTGADGSTADIIQEIEVVEANALSENRISLTIIALAGQGVDGSVKPGNVPMLTDVLNGLAVGYQPPGGYGVSNYRGTRRTQWAPSYTGSPTFPKAEYETFNGADQIPAYSLPAGTFTAVQQALIPQSGTGGSLQEAAIVTHPYHLVDITERVAIDSGMIVLPSQSLAGRDIAFQTRKPRVRVISQAKLVRLNKTPDRAFRDMPPNSVVVQDEFAVDGGVLDANNNRVFRAVHFRVVEMGDVGTAAAQSDNKGWATLSTGVPPRNFRYFWPKDNKLAMPFDPRVLAAGQGGVNGNTMFDGSPNAGEYAVGTPDPWHKP